MDLMIRGIAVYLFLLLIFRVSGKRPYATRRRSILCCC